MAGQFGGYIATPPSNTVPSISISGGVLSGALGAGVVLSGNIGSGQVDTGHFTSGAIATTARGTVSDFSGMVTGEVISGVRAVYLTATGTLKIAKAAVSGTMPAVGVVFQNLGNGAVVSGNALFFNGTFQLTSGLSYFPNVGLPVYVGRSGQLVQASGSWNSGGFLSGDLGQVLGVPVNSGGILLNVSLVTHSGAPGSPSLMF